MNHKSEESESKLGKEDVRQRRAKNGLVRRGKNRRVREKARGGGQCTER